MGNICSVSQGIGYQGEILLEFRNNGNTIKRLKVHNTGSAFLLTAIAKAICGNDTGDATPSRIDWRASEVSVLQSPVSVSGLRYIPASLESDTATVEVVALIKAKDITSNLSSGASTEFLLQTKNNTTLAAIHLSEEDSNVLYTDVKLNGYDCLVRWELQISNKSVQ